MNQFEISDKNIIVSGGSRGIGFEFARTFAQLGARVLITGRDEKALVKAVSEASIGRHPVVYKTCDVADEQSINTFANFSLEELTHLDVLVNCAGINIRKPVEMYTAKEFDLIMNTNMRGSFLMSQAIGKQMIKQKTGCIINIDSLSSLSSLAQVGPYGMSKAAMSSMTRLLALEWGKHGIRVNGIAPGFILTDLTKDLWSDDNLKRWNRTVTPLGRMGKVADLTGTATFLISDAASFISGQTIRVDGGISSGINWPIDNQFQTIL